MNAKLPIWKKMLLYIYHKNFTIWPIDAIYNDKIVKNKKAFQDVMYLLKKKGYVEAYWRNLSNGNYEISFSKNGKNLVEFLLDDVQLKNNQPGKNPGIEIVLNDKIIFSMNIDDAYKMLSAFKTISTLFKNAIKENV